MTPLRRFVRPAFSIDPALVVALAARIWQSLAGLLSLYFVIAHFDPATQGYYQTFVSLIALQWFVELGIIVAIVSIVSHEWAHLSMSKGRIVMGEPESINRLAGVTRFVALWFLCGSLLLLLAGGAAGIWILSTQGSSETWLRPWLVTIGVAAAFLWCQGMVAVVEGCNQILEIAVYRFVQAVVGSLTLWIAVANGAGLWSLAAMNVANLFCAMVFLGLAYGRFIWPLLANRAKSSFDWRGDVWPMQWPLALQGMTGYFMFSLFVPVIYTYHGVVEAGRIGISIQIVMAILAIATTWLTVKAPRLGTMYARADVRGFESMWLTAAAFSTAIACLGALAAFALLLAGTAFGVEEVGRFVGLSPFALLLGWAVLLHIVQCMAAYWRAQRREAVGLWGMVPGLVTGLGVWLLGRAFGSAGAAAAALATTALLSIPIGIHFLRKSRALSRSKARSFPSTDGTP